MFFYSIAQTELILKMKYPILLALATLASALPQKRATPQGIDVSSYQPNVDWTTVKNNGISFVYIKATEGTGKRFLRLALGPPNRVLLQIMSLLHSAISTLARPTLGSSAVVTTLLILTCPVVLLRLITSSRTVVRLSSERYPYECLIRTPCRRLVCRWYHPPRCTRY